MPELPDLQAFSKNLTKLLKGKKVAVVKLPYPKKTEASEKDFQRLLTGTKLKQVRRQGKELYFDFDNKVVVSLHLMLRGNLFFFELTHDKKYPIFEIHFSDKSGLVLYDFQGQAKPTLNPPEPEGVDALSDELTLAFLKDRLRGSKAAVKNLLLDQQFIRGIGNAYADEILWDAGISPFSIANKIPDSFVRKLFKSITKVLRNAEKQILKSNPDIISGEVRDFLNVHNPKRKMSPTGKEIKVATKGGRKTYYTEEQKIFD